MAKIIAMPILGEVKRERLGSLTACHALYERQVVRPVVAGKLGDALGEAIGELLLADRTAALAGKVSFVVTVEL